MQPRIPDDLQFVWLDESSLLVSCECIKVFPAQYIVEDEESKEPGKRIEFVTSSSGTFARGLAFATRSKGHGCVIVGEEQMQLGIKDDLMRLGAELLIAQCKSSNTQQARIDLLKEFLDRSRRDQPHRYFVEIKQYEDNRIIEGYRHLSRLIYGEIARKSDVDWKSVKVIGAVGSGGSTIGVSRGLSDFGLAVQIVGVDHTHSVLFGSRRNHVVPESLERVVRGIGNSVVVPILNDDAYKRVFFMSDQELLNGALDANALLARRGLQVGPTSGGSFVAWQRMRTGHAKQSKALSVLLCADRAWPYKRTMLDPGWCEQHGICLRDPGRKEIVRLPRQDHACSENLGCVPSC